jgi:hypothetical protein
MTGVRYVVLSDLHLGASYSLLTHATPDGTAQPSAIAPTLSEFSRSLRATLHALPGDEPPTRILLGDVFELAFAPPTPAMHSFQTVIRALFEPGEPPLFGPNILYLPGNHDHRQWQLVRDEVDLHALEHPEPGHPHHIAKPFVTTDLFATRLPVSRVVTALARRASGNDGLVVYCGYPNVGIRSGDRHVVLHHGHFTESMYRAISSLIATLSGRPAPTDPSEIELVDGPWIDFLWSTLGGQGAVGAKLFESYETLRDAGAAHSAVQAVAGRLIGLLGKSLPVRGADSFSARGATVSVREIVEGLLDLTFSRFAESERLTTTAVLTADGIAGTRWYLGKVVRPQLEESRWSTEQPVSFVFGHTHKPFADQLLVEGYGEPIEVWNTGGWVLDDANLPVTQGAAVVMIDDAGNLASLRTFNDPLNGEMAKVRALGCAGVASNPLVTALDAAVGAVPSWDEFTEVVGSEIDMRARFLRAMYFDPAKDPNLVPTGGIR